MDIFDYAMKMERDGESFYRGLADNCSSQGLKAILKMLADDEVDHYNTLQNLKEGVSAKVLTTTILKKAKNIFQQIKDKETEFYTDETEIELYEKAIEIEKKSEDFYRKKAIEVNQPELKDIFLKIAEDEKKHQFLLKNTTDFLSRPKTWIENAEFHHLEEY